MRKRINNYFIGGLLKNARAFDIARILLVYNFTLFYYFLNMIASLGWTGYLAIMALAAADPVDLHVG